MGAEELASWTKRLLCKHEDVRWDPHHPHTNWPWQCVAVIPGLASEDKIVPGLAGQST